MSSLELTERAFKRIDYFDPALRAFSYLLREEALVQAASADAQSAAGAVLGSLKSSANSPTACADLAFAGDEVRTCPA